LAAEKGGAKVMQKLANVCKIEVVPKGLKGIEAFGRHLLQKRRKGERGLAPCSYSYSWPVLVFVSLCLVVKQGMAVGLLLCLGQNFIRALSRSLA
jgi:hypothetical protein